MLLNRYDYVSIDDVGGKEVTIFIRGWLGDNPA